MAIVRHIFDSHEEVLGDGTVVTIAYWYDLDNATLNVVQAGCDNPGPKVAWCQVSLEDGTRSREFTVQPFTNASVVVPTGASQRLRYTINPTNGKLDGIRFLSTYG